MSNFIDSPADYLSQSFISVSSVINEGISYSSSWMGDLEQRGLGEVIGSDQRPGRDMARALSYLLIVTYNYYSK